MPRRRDFGLARLAAALLLVLLLLRPSAGHGASSSSRGLRAKKRRPAQPQPQPEPELTLASCYEPAVNGTNGTAPLFEGRFTEQSFPFCKVLAPGRAVLYWTWTNVSQARDGAITVGGPENGTAITGRGRAMPPSPADSLGVTITLGVLLRRNGTATASGSAWAAIGLSEESQGMPGMDVAMLRGPNANGSFVLEDHFATGYTIPELDQTQNKELLFAARAFPSTRSVLGAGNAGGDKKAKKKKEKPVAEEAARGVPVTTAFIFTMSAAANCEDGNGEDVGIVPGRSTFVMWASGPELDGGPTYHGPEDRGASEVEFLLSSREALARATAPVSPPQGDKDGKDAPRTLRVALPGVTVPEHRTTYMCMYAEVPQDRKYHIYQTRFLLNGSSSDSTSSNAPDIPTAAAAGAATTAVRPNLVHHAILYAVVQNETAPDVRIGEPYDCTNRLPISRGLPYLVASHQSLTSPSDQLWAAVDAALPLGRGFGKYVVLEVHYDNVGGVKGAVDSTGFELVLSPKLRSQDAGTLLFGSIPTIPETNTTSSLVIPPGQRRFDFVDYCPSTCTKEDIIPASPATTSFSPALPGRAHIVYARLHMHTLGIGGELQLIHNTSLESSNGTAPGRLVRRRLLYRDHWDFNNQQGVSFAPPGIPFGAGDGFLTRCSYSSIGHRNTTTWGETAEEEMCLTYVFAYPVTHPTACFDLTDARQPMLDAWTRVNKGKPLNLATCLNLPEYSQATASGNFAWTAAEMGMIVETPESERRFTRVSSASASEKMGNSTSARKREEVVWDPACRAK